MKKVLLLILLMPILIKAQETPISAFLIKWENSKNFLLEIAEAMPENKYDYKPTEKQLSFKKQLLHIQGNMNWLTSAYFKEISLPKKPANNSKKALIAYVKESFETVAAALKDTPEESLETKVDFFAGPKTKLQILNLLQDHVTHHRGQLIVYLNLNNITPPKYTGW